MSMWIYIRGCLKLEASCFQNKIGKDGLFKLDSDNRPIFYIPYPDEQLNFTLGLRCWASRDNYTDKEVEDFLNKKRSLRTPPQEYIANLEAYPIIKRAVENHIYDLPYGEADKFPYFLNVDHDDCNSSTSGNTNEQIDKLYKDYILNMLKENKRLWDKATWKDAQDCYPTELAWVEENNTAILTLHDSVRYCQTADMYDGLIKFFGNLVKDGISLDDGVIEIDDYFTKCILTIDGQAIVAHFEEGKYLSDEAKTNFKAHDEYWQEFETWYDDRPAVRELRKVDKFVPYDECNEFIHNIPDDDATLAEE